MEILWRGSGQRNAHMTRFLPALFSRLIRRVYSGATSPQDDARLYYDESVTYFIIPTELVSKQANGNDFD